MTKTTKSGKNGSPQSRRTRDRKAGKAKASPKTEVLPELPETEQPERKRTGPPKGNQFWKARSKHGREKIFSSPEILWEACNEYFEWVEANPLFESRPFAYQGIVVQEPVAKMRAMTVDGLCIFLDIGYQTWRDYAKRDDFSDVITRAESVIRSQKFAGAAADLLNANIIARDLGLKDSHDHELAGKGGGPIEHKIDHAGGVQFDRIKEKVDEVTKDRD